VPAPALLGGNAGRLEAEILPPEAVSQRNIRQGGAAAVEDLDAELDSLAQPRLAIAGRSSTLFTLTAGTPGWCQHTGRDTALVAGIVRVSVGGGEEPNQPARSACHCWCPSRVVLAGIQPANTPLSCLFRQADGFRVAGARNNDDVTVSASDGLVFWSKSVTRRQMGWLGANALVAGPLLPLVTRDTGGARIERGESHAGRGLVGDALSAFMAMATTL